MKNITEDEFDEKFKPITNPYSDSLVFETYGQEHNFVRGRPNNTVWTMLDDNTIVSGYHFVNRVGYYITEVPWTEDTVVIPETSEDEG